MKKGTSLQQRDIWSPDVRICCFPWMQKREL